MKKEEQRTKLNEYFDIADEIIFTKEEFKDLIVVHKKYPKIKIRDLKEVIRDYLDGIRADVFTNLFGDENRFASDEGNEGENK